MPSERAVQELRANMGADLLQPWPVTAYDRHPGLFAFARQELQVLPRPRILSYGCSTGEEPLTLAKYLPKAQIDAIDINRRSTKIAKRRAKRSGIDTIKFDVQAAPPAHADIYDAIFCLSVLRHGELDAEVPVDCGAILPFSSFDRIVNAFDQILKGGGLLFIWGSNFDFHDLPIAERYEPLRLAAARHHPGPVYGPDNHLKHEHGLHCFIFRKRS